MRLLLLFAVLTVAAQEKPKPLSARESDPARMGWMQGHPPPPDKLVRWAADDLLTFPKIRWSVSNIRQLMPTKAIARPRGAASELPAALERMAEIDALKIGNPASPTTWAQFLEREYTDGVILLHRGKIVYERYFGVTTPETQHLVFSVTKSLTGVIAASLIHEGKLDPNAKVGDLIPELKDKPAGAPTVRQVLDMTSGRQDPDTYAIPRAIGFLPKPAGYTGAHTTVEFLRNVTAEAEPGRNFVYKSTDAELLGWVLRRVTGKSLSELYYDRLWSPLGMESEAYFTVDTDGFEFAGGGLCATLRDLARFGEMVRQNGRFQGKQIVPSAVIEDIRRGANRELLKASAYGKLVPGYGYRSMWWVSGREGVFMGIGIHGQNLFIDQNNEMVIVRLGSHHNMMAGGPTTATYAAVARFLNGEK